MQSHEHYIHWNSEYGSMVGTVAMRAVQHQTKKQVKNKQGNLKLEIRYKKPHYIW